MLVTLAIIILDDCLYDYSCSYIPVYSNRCICQKNYAFYGLLLCDGVGTNITYFVVFLHLNIVSRLFSKPHIYLV